MSEAATDATVHVQERAMERYGLALSLPDLRALERRIVGGGSVLMRRQGDGSEVRAIMIGDVAVIVVWVPERARIATFLPKCAVAPGDRHKRILARKKAKGEKPKRRKRRLSGRNGPCR